MSKDNSGNNLSRAGNNIWAYITGEAESNCTEGKELNLDAIYNEVSLIYSNIDDIPVAEILLQNDLLPINIYITESGLKYKYYTLDKGEHKIKSCILDNENKELLEELLAENREKTLNDSIFSKYKLLKYKLNKIDKLDEKTYLELDSTLEKIDNYLTKEVTIEFFEKHNRLDLPRHLELLGNDDADKICYASKLARNKKISPEKLPEVLKCFDSDECKYDVAKKAIKNRHDFSVRDLNEALKTITDDERREELKEDFGMYNDIDLKLLNTELKNIQDKENKAPSTQVDSSSVSEGVDNSQNKKIGS